MSDFRADTSGINEFARRMAGGRRVVAEELSRAVTRCVIEGERESRRLVPVKTGNLRRSITHEAATIAGGTVRGRWGTNAPYAEAVEFGRGPVQANPARNHPVVIVPVNKQALRFVVGGRTVFAKKAVVQKSAALKFTVGGRTIYRKRVRAARPRPFLFAAARRLRGRFRQEFEAANDRIVRRLAAGR